jgi:[NiFe] hydrogenase assembly HybE family chaperone
MTGEAAHDAATARAERIAAVFRSIEQTRMAGVPILNPALSVEVVGMQPWKSMWFCILITPWFMNMLLLPDETGTPVSWAGFPAGESVKQLMPCGSFSFLVGVEEGLGTYLSCSLFSPVFEFASQDQAIETAYASITEIMKPEGGEAVEAEPAPPVADADGDAVPARQDDSVASPSRRKLFGLMRPSQQGEGA